MNDQPTSSGFSLSRLLAVGVFAAVLTGLVIVHTGAAFLAVRSPGLALALKPDEPNALITSAQSTLDAAVAESQKAGEAARSAVDAAQANARRTAKSRTTSAAAEPSSQVAQVAETEALAKALAPETAAAQSIALAAKRTLAAAPFDARALRLLAQLADAAGDTPQKRKLLEAIMRRTKNEPLAAYWLLFEAYQNGDEQGVIHYADLLLSKFSDSDPLVVPLLARAAEGKSGGEVLQARLKENPVWRGRFFHGLPSAVSDARIPLVLLTSLKGSPAPPTAQEIGDYLDFLMKRHLYEMGYYTWLQFLEPEKLAKITVVNNGGFEDKPATSPFDWTIPSSSGTIVEIGKPPGEASRALHVNFIGQGRVELQPVQQMLVLPSGRYRLTLRQKGEIVGRRGLQWIVSCVESQAKIGESTMFVGAMPDWKDLSAVFSVPGEGCRAQKVSLILASRSASEQIVRGEAWYDDVRVTRIETE